MVMSALLEQVKSALPKIQGWCSFEKASKFVEYILQNKPELVVEIGVFGGSSFIPQAMALKENDKGVIYGIDPWKTEDALESMISEDNRKWWSELNIEQIYKHFMKNIDRFDVKKYCKILRDKSENVVDQFADESIDLLHIDGNHSEDLSYKDATLYLPKVKRGGYIFFDDIWWTEGDNNVTTRKAILYLLQSCVRVDVVNNDCLIMQKQ
jgi:predicted O-methyltransferase YrrM